MLGLVNPCKVRVVVPDPITVAPKDTELPSLKAPNPSRYHLYEIDPLFSAGFDGD